MASREPLPGWTPAGWCRSNYIQVGEAEIWATNEGVWSVNVSFDTEGRSEDFDSARIAGEDAARAMVTDMARALGMTVTWTHPERDSATE